LRAAGVNRMRDTARLRRLLRTTGRRIPWRDGRTSVADFFDGG